MPLLSPNVYRGKKLTVTKAKYGAPNLELYGGYYFIVKNHSNLCSRKFTLRVDNQALSWLKTYSTDQAVIGRCIVTLKKYYVQVEHRPRTLHCNADGLSKRINDYRYREHWLEQLPPVAERWNVLSQDEFDKLPTAPWFDVQGRVIPNHLDLPARLRNMAPVAPSPVFRINRRTQRLKQQEMQKEALREPSPLLPLPELHAHEDFYPNYPADRIDVTEEASQDYLLPTHVANVPSRTVYSLADTSNRAMQSAPSGVRDTIIALWDLDIELHEHANTVHGIKDLVLAQNLDVHVLAIKKLVLKETIDFDIFPEDVREFASNYFKQKKELLFRNKNGILCMQYPPTQRPLHERPCMIVMPQLYQLKFSFALMIPCDIKVFLRWSHGSKNVIPGLAFAAACANM